MKKISIKSLLTAMCMLFNTSVYAYDFEVDGMYYNILNIETRTCEVTSGDRLYTGDIVIPEYVTLKGRTFAVTYIGENAFKDCIGLTSFVIPKFIHGVSNGAFNGCTALRKITIEDCENFIYLGYNSWHDSKAIFYDCPLEVVYLGRELYFRNSEGGRYKSFPPFKYKRTLTDITIGKYIKKIDENTFYGCTSLTNITFGSSVTEIGDYAFEDCISLTNITLGNSITTIGSCAFSGCTSLTNITWGNSITTIGNCAFSGCTSLTNITLENSITTVGSLAFADCEKLGNITLGNSITDINCAFENCINISTIYSLNPTPPTSEQFTIEQYLNIQLYVPQGSLSSYQSEIPWKYFWNISEFDPTEIKNVTLDDNGKDMIYDLQGNKLTTPQKGLNIINGKKVIMK